VDGEPPRERDLPQPEHAEVDDYGCPRIAGAAERLRESDRGRTGGSSVNALAIGRAVVSRVL
jgi:hypothetical protein